MKLIMRVATWYGAVPHWNFPGWVQLFEERMRTLRQTHLQAMLGDLGPPEEVY